MADSSAPARYTFAGFCERSEVATSGTHGIHIAAWIATRSGEVGRDFARDQAAHS